MKKQKFLTVLLSLALIGVLGIGAVKATAIVTPLDGEVVEYTLNNDENTVFTA
jgi:hypothetical protein